jgi:glycosyltransferase involved in cell wall biosynthesis
MILNENKSADLVTILVSSYNGFEFIKDQLDSLYNQSYSNIKILVRDDASTDTTRDILRVEHAKQSIDLVMGEKNLGVTASFFELLRQASKTDTEYVAFCDQDDVWLPNKMQTAVLALSKVSEDPALYCSRLNIVDEKLNQLDVSFKPREIGFGNALVENIAVGCTIVLNRKALDLLCQYRLPEEVYIHDWWCYLVISCFGQIVFDDQALIQYRQHSGNSIGAASNLFGVLRRKFARLFNRRLWISEQAAIFHSLYAEQLAPAQRDVLELLLNAKSSFWHRLMLICSKGIWRQKIIDNLILRVVIFINRI